MGSSKERQKLRCFCRSCPKAGGLLSRAGAAMMVRAKINAIAGASNTVDRPSLVHDLELQRSPAVILCPPRNNSDCSSGSRKA